MVVAAGRKKSLVVAVGAAPNAICTSWSQTRNTTVHFLLTPLLVAAEVPEVVTAW
jgi:hypothetical protein